MGLAAVAALIAISPATPAFAQSADERIEWNRQIPPFRIAGNLYYVGVAGIGAYLVATPRGLILVDGGLPESAPIIARNIQALGFKVRDIKIILTSHAHFDHVGGVAELKRLSRARLYISAGDRPIVERGAITYGPSAGVRFTPAHVDHVVADGERVALGGAVLTAHLTPGHTPGCTSWTLPLSEGGRAHTAILYCSTTVAGNPLLANTVYPRIAADYEASFARLKRVRADIFLGPHGNFFHLDEKRARMRSGGPNPFIDAGEFQAHVAASERDFHAALAAQRAALNHKAKP